MAFLNDNLTPDEIKARDGYQLLPTGEYVAQIVDSDVKPTKDGNGSFLELHYKVMEGDCKDMGHIERITLDSVNEVAVRIGRESRGELYAAIGLTTAPRDSSALHYKPHVIRVDFQPAGSLYTSGRKKGTPREYDEANIKAYKALDGAAQPTGNPAAAPYARPAASSNDEQQPPNWARRPAA